MNRFNLYFTDFSGLPQIIDLANICQERRNAATESLDFPFVHLKYLAEFIGLGQQLAFAPKPTMPLVKGKLIADFNLEVFWLAVVVFLTKIRFLIET